MKHEVRELSLFSGAGGGLLGTKLLGWEHVGYVEYDEYCQKIIRQRIDDGILDDAPIFGDIRTFNAEGYAVSYQGLVDVITAGFPCQPFSIAGKRAGGNDERNMWPATIDVIRRVRPRYCLLENVPGLLSSGYMGRVFGDLAESGFDAKWRVLSAAECGAPHKRDRLWVVATNTHSGRAYAKQELTQECESTVNSSGDGAKESMANAGRGNGQGARRCVGSETQSTWWGIEPDVDRVANGVAARVDRLKATGNGQVPAVVRAAWELIGST